MIDLIKGDCLQAMQAIPDGSVDMILTDPPYGTTACKFIGIELDDNYFDIAQKRITEHQATLTSGFFND